MSAEITAAPAAVEGEKPATTTNGAKEVEVGEKRKAEETAASDEKKCSDSLLAACTKLTSNLGSRPPMAPVSPRA